MQPLVVPLKKTIAVYYPAGGGVVRKLNYLNLFFLSSVIISLTLFLSSCGGGNGGRSNSGEAPSNDTTPPTVSSTSPANGNTGVALNSIIRAIFSEPINPDTLTANTFIVLSVGTSGGVTVSGTIAYTAETMTASFTPAAVLGINTTYTMTITTAVEDKAGNPMAATFSWSFTTGSAIDNSAPSFSGNDPQLVAQATSSNSISLEWVAASDNTTPQNQLIYVVCRSTVSTDCTVNPFSTGGDVTLAETSAGQTALGISGLNINTTYYFVVRAKDQVNLLDSNVAQKSAATLGVFKSLKSSLNSDPNFDKDAIDPTLTVSGTTLYLAWQERTTPPTIYFRTFDTTLSQNLPNTQTSTRVWSAATSISSAGNHAKQPRLISDRSASAVPYITYTECDGSELNCKIYVKRWNGAAINPWELVGGTLNIDSAQSAGDSAIAFDDNNVPYVIWTEQNISGINQIYVKHLVGVNWVQDGGSLNVSALMYGLNPSIAIDGTTIKTAWTECPSTVSSNCQLYVKGWDLTNSIWTPSNPTSLKAGDPNLPSRPDDVSLAFINHVLHVSWHESSKVYVRKEAGSIFTPVIKQGSASTAVSDSVSSSSYTPLATSSTAPSTQAPYLVFADTTNATQNAGPFLFIKRWNGTDWIVEEGGALDQTGNLNTDPRLTKSLNMTGGVGSGAMHSAIAFLGGTPIIAWTETGSCLVTNGCGQNKTTVSQLYVKRLE